MDYFWIVLAVVVLLYIIYVYRRVNRYVAVRNANLAKYTYDQLTDERHETLLDLYGCYIVNLFFLVGLFLNGAVATLYFKNGQWLFGIWAIFSIILLPKAALGLILLLGRKSLVFLNMSWIIMTVFPGTIRRYRSDSLISSFGSPVLKGFIKEIIWFVISLVPIITFIIQN